EASRAGHPYSAAYDQNIAVLTLVSGARPRRKHTPDLVFAEAQRRGRHVRQCVAANLQIVEHERADVIRPRADIETKLQADERHRAMSAHGGAEHGASIAVPSARHVAREHGASSPIDRIHD